MTEYDKVQNAINCLLTDLPMLGRFVAILPEPVDDADEKPSFLTPIYRLGVTSSKGRTGPSCTCAHRTRFDVWVASNSRDSKCVSPAPTYMLLRLMTPGAEVDKVVFHEPGV